MSNIIDISTLVDKSVTEQKEYIQKQHATITSLMSQVALQKEEIEHLKTLVISTHSLSHPVEKILVSPEEALIDAQISLIQQRSYEKELTLEDVKKLDLLLKNKNILKEQGKAIKSTSKKVELSNAQLIEIVSKNDK